MNFIIKGSVVHFWLLFILFFYFMSVARQLILTERFARYPAFSKLKITHFSPQKVILQMPVESSHLNFQNGLFGGITASLIDIGGTMAIYAKQDEEKMDNAGVSVDLSVSYLNGGKLGDLLTIHSVCDKFGKNLAFTRVDILVDEKVIATGRHTKYMGLGNYKAESSQ
ncbi:HotDog domain-containing protein [Globomyces pollinis-pini]|nr:HotDog domain-containing protein [Globomyces pollinis-pini]